MVSLVVLWRAVPRRALAPKVRAGNTGRARQGRAVAVVLMILMMMIAVVGAVVMGHLTILTDAAHIGVYPAIQVCFARRLGDNSLVDDHAAMIWCIDRSTLQGKVGTKDGN